jgi:hypothetical protein
MLDFVNPQSRNEDHAGILKRPMNFGRRGRVQRTPLALDIPNGAQADPGFFGQTFLRPLHHGARSANLGRNDAIIS